MADAVATSPFSAEQARKLVWANLLNIGRAVMAGKPLTKGQLDMLHSAVRDLPEGEEDRPKVARNAVELAKVLNATRNSVTRRMKIHGNPGRRLKGRHPVEQWIA